MAAASAPPSVTFTPPADGSDSHPDAKRAKDFLYPKMPGAFRPYNVRRMPVEQLRARYITVLSATMGNHSMSLFYCCWTQEQFEEVLTAKFRKEIARAKAALADRATFIMHRGMGLIQGSEETGPANAQVTSALAKVVDSLKAKDADQEEGGGFKLVVEGLDRSQGAPPAGKP